MLELVKIRARPKLKSPVMLAAWPGIGDVALIVASYLKKKLEFKDLAEIEPSWFFDPIGVLVKDNIVEEPQFPRSVFYYWKNKGKDSDIILFIGEDQPSAKGYDMAHCVLDVAERYNVKRVYCCAAALSRIHHTEQSGVWGVATSPEVLQDLQQYNLVQRGNLQIAGLNGLLLGVAKERGIEASCLLGEVPAYASRMQNPMAALAVLKMFMKILNIDVDITELAMIASEAMEKYIDYFTQPIWEQGEEGEYGDEEEGV
jgi:proteasome assembly chaperone (PAC2) family protein